MEGRYLIQDYLVTTHLSKHEKITLFKLRSRSFDFKSNFPTKYEDMKCRICDDENTIENEEHTFSCPVLLDKLDLDEPINIDDIFSTVPKQMNVMKNIMKVMTRRRILLELRGKY